MLQPTLVWDRRDLDRGWIWQATLHGQLRQWTQAQARADQAIPLYTKLVEENPTVTKFATELRDAFASGIGAARELGNDREVQARLHRAQEFWTAHPVASAAAFGKTQ